MIDEFRKAEKLIFAKNRKEFLGLMEKDHILALSKFKNKRFECFDKEMADGVIHAFTKCSNMEKFSLVGDFKEMWELIIQSPDIDLEKTLEGFRYLYTKLTEAKNSVDETKAITLSHFDSFIELTGKFIEKLEASADIGSTWIQRATTILDTIVGFGKFSFAISYFAITRITISVDFRWEI